LRHLFATEEDTAKNYSIGLVAREITQTITPDGAQLSPGSCWVLHMLVDASAFSCPAITTMIAALP
jgi:hypothetical protein